MADTVLLSFGLLDDFRLHALSDSYFVGVGDTHRRCCLLVLSHPPRPQHLREFSALRPCGFGPAASHCLPHFIPQTFRYVVLLFHISSNFIQERGNFRFCRKKSDLKGAKLAHTIALLLFTGDHAWLRTPAFAQKILT
jgi:hypothetical protein